MKTLLAFLLLQAAGEEQKIEQWKVDSAVDKGGKYLLAELAKGLPKQTHFNHKGLTKRDITLYALIYAGVGEENEVFAKNLEEMTRETLVSNYGATVKALVLEEFDRVVYQERIAHCAQFLVDNQSENGQWFYGKEVQLGPWKKRKKRKRGTTALRRIEIRKRDGQGENRKFGDNSNTQYALLGLRACLQAGVIIPAETLALSEEWWTKQQNKDGGWDYDCYETRGSQSYGGMTCGAVGSLAICKYYLKKNWEADPAIRRGLSWLAKNFSPKKHAGFVWGGKDGGTWYYYYLYAIERAGMLCETEKFGEHEWYPAGAKELLSLQNKDGSWREGKYGDSISETAFAILFLRRATRPLKPVETKEAGKKK